VSSTEPLDTGDIALFDESAPNADTGIDPFRDVIGQGAAVTMLRSSLRAPVHAYLLLGPHGSGKRRAALAFAAGLLSAGSAPDAARRAVELSLAEQHPDLIVVEREGAAISAAQAEEIVRRASRSPMEGSRKVLVLDEFHLVSPAAASKLLKTIEEPPAGTFFLVLAEEVTPDLVTIASRCVQVALASLPADVVRDALIAEGVEPDQAAAVADHAEGDLGRARLLATDQRLAIRLQSWQSVPSRLDGRGATAVALVDEIRANIDTAEAPLRARHAAEAEELNARIERYGQRGSGTRQLDERHRRERRRLRTDEVRMGLTALSRAYRDELAVASDPRPALDAIAAVHRAAEALIRNPNEELLLVALLLALPPLM
jgi:DNA polymerase-3 subunit delta'